MHKGQMKRSVVIAVLLLLTTVLAAPATAQQGARGAQVEPLPLPERSLMEIARSEGVVPVIVELAAPYTDESFLSPDGVTLQRSNLSATRSTILGGLARFAPQVRANSTEWTIPFLALEVNADALLELQQSPYIVDIMLDELSRPLLNSSLPVQDVPQAHIAGYTGQGTVVAVLDTGVLKTHEFLNGKVIAEACFSQNSSYYGSTSLCPNGKNTQIGDGAALPTKCAGADGCAHGTHVAGIVAGGPLDPASIPGSTVYSGVAPGAKIYAVQVFSRFNNYYTCGSFNPCVLTYASDQVAALQRVYADRALYNIVAVNMSLGGGAYKKACDSQQRPRAAAINALYNVGIATIIASGNDGSIKKIGAPGCIANAITVGSVTDSLTVSNFSNSNKLLDLWGIGTAVTSSVTPANTYQSYDGTSMATPTVAGAWAVIKSIRPSASVPEVLQLFNDTGIAITDLNQVTRDLIQVGDAVTLALGLPAPVNLLTDGDFEGASVPRVSAWKQNGSSATVVCGAGSYAGICFASATAGKGKLTQKINGTFAKKNQITLSGFIAANNATKGKIQLKVNYKDGSSGKIKFTVQGTNGYTFRTGSLTLKQKASSFNIVILSPKTGSFSVDNLTVTVD